MYIDENESRFCEYNQQSKNPDKKGRSFNLSGYGFDSGSEKDFFVRNLLQNNQIKHIWFTGMLTNGQSDFYVHYIDPELHTLRSYYPDFLVELSDGQFYIVEIKGENLIDKASTNAKAQYANMILQTFISQMKAKTGEDQDAIFMGHVSDSDFGKLKVADPGKD